MTKAVNDFEELASLALTSDGEINHYITSRKLPIMVADDWTVYYKTFASGNDMSLRRSIQEICTIISQKTSATVKSIPVNQAAFESFQTRSPIVIKRELDEQEANNKIEELLQAMVDRKASDLHIKIQEYDDVTYLKMRVNGLLENYAKWSFGVGDALLRSLWIHYGNCDRAERSINNGSFYYRPTRKRWRNEEYMVRMTESPEARGTMFVARIRDPHQIRPLERIGFTHRQRAVIQNLLALRAGLVCINGPTNSGKSSTQSSMLSLMPSSMHIVEIGDPVETYQHHIAHFELKEFADGGKEAHLEQLLGSTVRQDADILALTEMRDRTTAKAALQLASQGKLVLTTMHTTDFIGAFGRLLRMGLSCEDITAPGFLKGLVSQRLLPKICPCCALPQPNADDVGKRFTSMLRDTRGGIRYRNPTGCKTCHHTGIISRVLVAEAVEILPEVLPSIRSILYEHDPAPFHRYARQCEIINIHQHARDRILASEVDPIMAEREIGRFGPDNLLWLYPDKF